MSKKPQEGGKWSHKKYSNNENGDKGGGRGGKRVENRENTPEDEDSALCP